MNLLGKRPNLLFMIAIHKLPVSKWVANLQEHEFNRLLFGSKLYWNLVMVTKLCRDVYVQKLLRINGGCFPIQLVRLV